LATEWPDSRALSSEHDDHVGLERLGAFHVWRALRALGVALRPGVRVGPETAEAVGVQRKYVRLWRRLLQIAEQAGFVAPAGDAWIVTPAGAGWDGPQTLRGPARVEAALLERCGSALATVLRGQQDPLALLFPPDGVDSAAQIYGEAPSARVYNRLAAEAVARLAHGQARRPRVLEIGAGTGATTASLIASLPPGCAYCYTDVSPLFLHDAEARFEDAPLDLSFRRLDIEQPPESQGFVPGSFDIVVAANVLHATADLGRTLRNVRTLLAPCGVLVLVETVARRAWADLSFGLTEGWWRFDDAPLRTDDALLDAAAWTAVLGAAGFDTVHPLGEALSRDSVHPQALILARSTPAIAGGAPSRRFEGTAWRIVADRGGFGARLAEAICAAGGTCECVDPGDAVRAPGDSVQGIVHCAALDAPPAAATTVEQLDAAVSDGLGSALACAQRLATAGRGGRLWLVTRGAQRVGVSDRVFSPAQSLLWGLGRSIALEQPQAWGGLVDLDPEATDAQAVSDLLD